MSSVQGPFVAMAMGRLHRAVCVCCWLVGVALAVQLLIWCIATFMDVRFEPLHDKSPTAMIVTPTEPGKPETATVVKASAEQPAIPPIARLIDSNRVQTKYDHIMAKISALAIGAGTLAMLIMIPLMVLGVLLGVSTATPGVDKTISAFIWALIVGLLILPIGDSIGMPWREGSLVTYSYMTRLVDLQLNGDPARWGHFQFYSRFAVLPLASIVGLAIVGLRFSFGVSAGLGKEDHRLDPVLEKEAANIKPSSLHGGRTGAALKAMTTATVANGDKKPGAASQTMQVAEGEMPRRLI